MTLSPRVPAFVVSCLLLLSPVLPAHAQQRFSYDGPVITFRFSHFLPENFPTNQNVDKKWFEMVERESNGKIKIKPFYSGVLHAPKDGFKAAVNDITDFTPAYTSYQPGSFHLPHVMELPFAFPSAAVAVKVAEELYPKYFKKEYEAMGVYLANYNGTSSYNIFTKKPVTTLEQLKGMKIRSSGGQATEILQALGTVPVSMPTPEMYQAFQRGVVDGVALYNTAAVGFRINELATSMTELRLFNFSSAWAFNRKTWDAMPPEVKRFMYNMQRRLAMMYGIEYDRQDSISRQKFIDQGIQIVAPSPKEMERWKAAVEPLWTRFIEENEAKGRPARALVADLRALVKKYETWTPEQLMKEVTERPVRGLIDGM